MANRPNRWKPATFDPRKVKKGDWQYLAGIIDGEGCISNIGPSKETPKWRIIVGSTDPELIEWLHKRFGGTVTYNGLRYNNPKHWKRIHHWSLGRKRDIQQLLIYVRPYIVIHRRRARIDEVLAGLEDSTEATM